ncbi:uncharacterized protein LOC106668936 isoform X2 [Cimex lectularius]|nr:uncharacterized protein LOC106668936 isoform X2 [Cimex lectularius]XP_024081931.1 uncharacterized protein LOC106668936 isoform X2 [Cimex lectularius]
MWHQNIDKLLLSYLEAEESPRKLEEKKKLEAQIKNYLSIVPHKDKFYFRETAQVLHRSVEEIEDFTAYQTTAAWSALVAYAHNLIVQPWRKEFREIKTYSGFYKHHIEASLIGGEIILELMGYQSNGSGSMRLNGPVNKEQIMKVSKDSFIALVECQIMRTIIENMIKSVGYCTWFDVLHYRETHICSPEEATKDLINIAQQYYYRDMYTKYAPDHVGCSTNYRYSHPHVSPHSIYMQGAQPLYGTYLSQPLVPHFPICSPNGYYTTCNYEISSNTKPYSCSVPTAKLIELEPSPSSNSGLHKRSISDVKDHGSRQHSSYEDSYKHKSKDERCDLHWRYNSNKSANSNFFKNNELSDVTSNLLEPLSLNETSSKHNSSEPSCSKQETYVSARKKAKDYSVVDSSKASQPANTDKSKQSKDSTSAFHEETNDFWACYSCTYHNNINLTICEMCNKSRTQGNEIQPLISGGSQCPNCTLVNEKGLKNCKACNICLENSPTYI